MCGRVNVADNEGVRLLLAMLGMDTWPIREARYNIAPTQALDVVACSMATLPTLVPMSWGVSMTMKGKAGSADRQAHSRIRAMTKSGHHGCGATLIPKQRVLIPVNGFYEWQRVKGKPVQAYYITPTDAEAMFLRRHLHRLPSAKHGRFTRGLDHHHRRQRGDARDP